MSSGPEIYTQAVSPSAQMFTSGVPGAPPTIAVNTDGPPMSQFGSQMVGVRPQRSNITLKRKNVSFGEQPSHMEAGMRVNVTKGS